MYWEKYPVPVKHPPQNSDNKKSYEPGYINKDETGQ